MYLFFDNVPSNPTAEILKLKLQSSSYPGAARCNARFGELKPGWRSLHSTPYSPYVYCIYTAVLQYLRQSSTVLARVVGALLPWDGSTRLVENYALLDDNLEQDTQGVHHVI